MSWVAQLLHDECSKCSCLMFFIDYNFSCGECVIVNRDLISGSHLGLVSVS